MTDLRRWTLLAILIAIVAVMSVAFVGCGPAATEPADPDDETPSDDPADPDDEDAEIPTNLLMGRVGPPDILNPLKARGGATAFPISQIYGTLVTWDNNQEYVGFGADSWDVSDDGRTYTFYLNPDNVWHDGEPVVAMDYKMTFELCSNPDSFAIAYSDLMTIEGTEEYFEGEADEISGIVIVDDHTLEITTKAPDAVALLAFMQPVLPHHILGDVDPVDLDDDPFFNDPIGFGPFKFVEYVTDTYLSLERHDDFVLGVPGMETVIIDYSDSTNHVAMAERGELDWIRPGSDLDRVANYPHMKIYTGGPYGYHLNRLNHNREQFQDVRVRQALTHAIDREGMLQTAGQGNGEVAHAPFIAPWVDMSGVVKYDYDPDRARELLEEAGWDEDYVIEYLTFDHPRYTDMGAIVERNFDAVGVKMEITLGDFNAMNGRYRNNDYDIYSGYFMFSDDPHKLATSWHSASTENWYNGYTNPRLDELFDAGRATLDVEERGQIYGEIVQILTEEAVEIGTYGGDSHNALHKNVEGKHVRDFYHFMQFQDIHNLWEWEWVGPR